MPIIVRPERLTDYALVAELNALAFDGRPAEPAIVALLRQGPRFDPRLSLVAELDGRVVGHVLFTPHRLQLMGRPVAAVNLAPLAVQPDFQRQGLGGRLIEAGHAAARDRGFALSFLLGHHTYYPRFGYRTHAYGPAALSVATHEAAVDPALASRPFAANDVAAVHALWQAAEANVDFALDPGEALLDWLSPNPAIRVIVFERAGRVVAYARQHRNDPARPRAFLAEDPAVTRAVAAHLAQAAGVAEVVLPVHPASAANLPGARVTAWQAGMACALVPGALDAYWAAVEAGQRPPGSVTWPVAFDVAE
jgi:putative acetyltransferase